ncbi:hypothetical protein CEUSTIGMA_g2991.t1 [Chlamydomonas eustigma]|uniref:LIM zinc-binding domain-containing protein n=1 Tax=Chlamydomonas eustigma TaxID=1157962 RepID=A0A250WXH6_9CHLO|nr:hypothetical protein CEUSTIGMA_g2991.t1 [Chlamydomonas eustigma]|eukprot:GAX75548.1 hypothetical protein CEUSTIGMA_g2991.t1 [Chlamydomonas eustigma]
MNPSGRARTQEQEDLELALAISASLEQGKGPGPVPALQNISNNRPPQIGHHAPQPLPSQPAVTSKSKTQQRHVNNVLPVGPDVCPGCRTSVSWYGQHIMALGHKWHAQCLRCALCNEPLSNSGGAQFAKGSDGMPYHTACHKTKFHPVCAVCSNFIPERLDGLIQFKELSFWHQKVCMHHLTSSATSSATSSDIRSQVVQCCSCSRYQSQRGPQFVNLEEGRNLCLECVSSVVLDTKDAQPLYEDVLNFYTSMGMQHPHHAPFVLVDSKTLNEYSSREGRDSSGGPIFHVRGLCLATVYRSVPTVVRSFGALGLNVRSVATPLEHQARTTCSVSAILVMYGLPRLLTGCIIAHELMHAWLRMRNVASLDAQVEEGMCQLMALLWLDRQHDTLKRDEMQQRLASYFSYQIREDTSVVYGEGFRIAYDAFQKHGGGMRGLSGVINSILMTGRIQ